MIRWKYKAPCLLLIINLFDSTYFTVADAEFLETSKTSNSVQELFHFYGNKM